MYQVSLCYLDDGVLEYVNLTFTSEKAAVNFAKNFVEAEEARSINVHIGVESVYNGKGKAGQKVK